MDRLVLARHAPQVVPRGFEQLGSVLTGSKDAELLARCRALPAATQRCMMAPYRAQSGPECNAALEALDTPTRDRLSALLVDRPE